MSDDQAAFEEIEVPYIPEPDDDDGASDPYPDMDSGYTEGQGV